MVEGRQAEHNNDWPPKEEKKSFYKVQKYDRISVNSFYPKPNKNNKIPKFKNNIFVHRDFHVSNLMKVNKQIGVLDSQDSIIGNPTYDLVSLIDDVRIKTSSD